MKANQHHSRSSNRRTLRCFHLVVLCIILINAVFLTMRSLGTLQYFHSPTSQTRRRENVVSAFKMDETSETVVRNGVRKINTSVSVGSSVDESLSKQKRPYKESAKRGGLSQPRETLEFVHIPKTGGSAIEYAGAKANITWGLCHWSPRPSAGPGCRKADWLKFNATQNLDYKNKVEYSWEIWHTPPSWLKKNSPYENKKLFAVVRNPYERFLSEFYCPYNGLNPVDWTLPEEDQGFVDPMAKPIEEAKKQQQEKTTSQRTTKKPETPETLNEFIMDRLRYFTKWTAHYLPQADFIYDEDGTQVVPHVLKYENLTAEFAALMQQYELPVSLSERTNAPKKRQQPRMSVADLYPETIRRINQVASKDFQHFGYRMLNPEDQSKENTNWSAASTSVSSSAPVRSNRGPPSIAFLFMTTHELNEDLWERWFPQNDSRYRYSIFVHTVPSNTTVPLGPFFCPYAIPSTPTAWYDLHDGMMQVLQHAFDADEAAEHFVFVSATSIPLVSFEDMYTSLMKDGAKSRMCWGRQEKAELAWKYTHEPLRVNKRMVRKAEMWSKLSRQHAHILLNEQRALMNEWNKVFVDLYNRTKPRTSIGAPDECFFPTVLSMKSDPSEFQSCSEQGHEFPSLENKCCTTQVIWKKPNDTVYVPGTNNVLSDSCKRGWPCSFLNLHEEGLVLSQKNGFLFLRKVPPEANVTNLLNETLPLNDALIQLHAKKPMLPVVRSEKSFVGRPEGFQCSAPRSADNFEIQ